MSNSKSDISLQRLSYEFLGDLNIKSEPSRELLEINYKFLRDKNLNRISIDEMDIIYDDNANEVLTNLYKMDPVEDLNNLVEKFSLLHTVCQDTVVSNCYSYSKCNLDSGMNEVVVHNSVIPSVMAPDINTVYNNATAD